MSNFLEYLRQQNIFGSRPPMIGNDLPSQGGITGRMPLPPGPNTQMDINFGGADPTQYMPPPMFDADTDYLTNLNQPTFGPTDMPDPQSFQAEGYTPREPISSTPSEMDAGARMRELYQPQTESTDRFNQMINQYPQEEKPSWLRRIGAMVVDYSKGSRAGQEFFNEPYDRKITEWKNKIGPAQQSANLERYENVNQRTLAYNQIAAELREKAQIAKEKNDTRNAEIRQQRADIYEFKATHPNWKIMMPKGGNIVAINPMTGETHDTGIPTGSMTDLDKLTLGQENALERIGATGEQARETEGVRQAGRETLVGMRGEEARKTRETVPGGVGGRAIQPSQVRVDQANKARQIVNANPELAQWIKLGSGNEFTVVPPGKDFWGKPKGPTPEQYSQINKFIYGDNPRGLGGRGNMAGPGPNATSSLKPPPAPAGWKYVPKPGGGWTAVKDTGIQ
jgi:hypothetical protein